MLRHQTVLPVSIQKHYTQFHCSIAMMDSNVFEFSLSGLVAVRLGVSCAVRGALGAVAQLVEALRYRKEGRGFDSRWRINDTSPSVHDRNNAWQNAETRHHTVLLYLNNQDMKYADVYKIVIWRVCGEGNM